MEPLSNFAFKFNVRRYAAGQSELSQNAAAAGAVVGRCRLTVSRTDLKARLVSALETKM
jgi:hypothetical protein